MQLSWPPLSVSLAPPPSLLMGQQASGQNRLLSEAKRFFSNERGLLCLLQVFERILFIWAIRHPASGYVQGINDLVTPFFVVFLSEFVSKSVLQKACRCWCRTLACAPSLCFQPRMWRTLRCRLCRCQRRGTLKLIPFGA